MNVFIFITAVYFYFPSLKFLVINETTIIICFNNIYLYRKIFIIKGGNLFSGTMVKSGTAIYWKRMCKKIKYVGIDQYFCIKTGNFLLDYFFNFPQYYDYYFCIWYIKLFYFERLKCYLVYYIMINYY
jgi:hypothetical protein